MTFITRFTGAERVNDIQDIKAIQALTDILDKLKIAYAIGGSMASSVYGAVRFTQDADITVAPFNASADDFCRMIEKDFYVSREAVYSAIRNYTGFNVIHTATAFKIDIFVMADREFREQILSRRKKLLLGGASAKPLSFVSPEDIVLLKLDWYRQSGCASERQWSDVLGVLTAQASSLDFEYLKTWACKLGVEVLLKKAMEDSRKK